MNKETMKQALEALMAMEFHLCEMGQRDNGHHKQVCEAITSLRTAIASYSQAIAEAEKQEPVAWGMQNDDGKIYDCITPEEHDRLIGEYTVPLYTTPQPAQKPLTDEQIATISVECATVSPSDIYFARAIEAAHGIKENT